MRKISLMRRMTAAPFKFRTFSRKQRMLLNWWHKDKKYHDMDGIIADGAIRSGKTVAMVEALPAAAGTLAQLLFAGGMAEIGGRAAHIVDITLEILILYHDFRFFKNGFMAAGLDDASLMEGQCTEGTGTEAATVGNQ